jgi:hypothetical protein
MAFNNLKNNVKSNAIENKIDLLYRFNLKKRVISGWREQKD